MASLVELNSQVFKFFGNRRSTEASIALEFPKKCGPRGPAGSKYLYTLYGITLRSDIPLALERQNGGGDAAIEIRTEPASFFRQALRGASFPEGLQDWYQYTRLEDLSSYACWKGLGEFLVSKDGRQVHCRKFRGALSESFQVYLLQRALSFALVKQGFEPLHATAVVVNGQAIAFLGKSGFGKSVMATSFLGDGPMIYCCRGGVPPGCGRTRVRRQLNCFSQ